ncbi:MAG TPA: hypothetical protein VNJ08_03325 [Bacteriovoracaceae bacterium]|nr:hypothetical protein [Bacteriovoracaceae bacterium]
MLNLIQKFFSNVRSDKSVIRKNFSVYFYSLPEHQWIIENNLTAHFNSLFSHLPSGVLEALMSKYPVVFVPSEMLKDQQPVGMVLTNTIVIFPEFQKLLKTNKKSAVAYLAHELAFVLYEFEGNRNDPLMAEIEADKFVCDLGLTFELEELLLMLDETVEKRLRLTYLTINHFTSELN